MLSVVCPVYNEAANVHKLFDQFKDKVLVPMEIVVIYDHDGDNTVPVVREIAEHYSFNIRLVKNYFGTGALNAIKTGFMEANSEAVLVVMADLSDDISIVNEMYRLITAEGFDVVCGSRYMRGGRQIGGPVIKKTFSRWAGVSLHYLAGVPTHDVTNSFKMYSRRLLNSVELESQGGFEIGMELLVKAFVSGRNITEIPSIWTDRVKGTSRFRMWKWIPKYLRWYLYAVLSRDPSNVNRIAR